MKSPMELSTEEGQHILGAEAQQRVLQQFFIKGFETCLVFKHDVGRILSLVSHPVVFFVMEQSFQ